MGAASGSPQASLSTARLLAECARVIFRQTLRQSKCFAIAHKNGSESILAGVCRCLAHAGSVSRDDDAVPCLRPRNQVNIRGFDHCQYPVVLF
jgi:hypothetical protein